MRMPKRQWSEILIMEIRKIWVMNETEQHERREWSCYYKLSYAAAVLMFGLHGVQPQPQPQPQYSGVVLYPRTRPHKECTLSCERSDLAMIGL